MKNLLTRGLLCSVLLSFGQSARSQINVLTNRYDNARTGANLQETVLNNGNLNVNQFGRLYSYSVDGAIYAQPLYVSGVSIAGATHNVVFVETMNDKVYAFDADQPGVPLWFRDFTDPANGITPVPISDLVGSDGLNIVGNVGIESTPVIDLSKGTMYLVARTKENGSYVQRLHALDITTGAEKAGSPVTISGSVSGSAPDAVNGVLSFDPKMHNQRAGLALTNGVVLVSWASHEDDVPFHGWIVGYDAGTLRQVGVFCTTPNGNDGGIWQSGRGPVIDSSGYAYYQTGNGNWDGQTNFGDSIIKLKVSTQGLSLTDWFTPDNQSALNAGDIDLGSTGPMLIPGTDIIVGGGKESILYLTHSASMGHEAPGNDQIIQTVSVNGGEMKGGPAFWNGPAGPLVYTWPENDFVKAFHFNGTTLDGGIFAAGSIRSPGSPGGALTVSANGSSAGTGIVWAVLSTSQDSDHGTVAGVLRAFDATTLQELWDSELSPARDRLGTLVKFVPPVVANGKVYAATYDNALLVYGLLPQPTTTPDFSLSAIGVVVAVGQTINDAVNVGFLNSFSGTVGLSIAGLPSGATATFTPSSLSQGGTATLQITASAAMPTGTYPVTIAGKSGAITHSVTVQLTVSSTPPAPAKGISIDFVGRGTPMQANEVAGVVAKANWNSAAGPVSTQSLSLMDENGTATGAAISWTSDNTWSTQIADMAGNARMMKGYLDTGEVHTTVVTVNGLPLSPSGYDVYVYTDGDNAGATRTGIYQISGPGITTTAISAMDPASTDFSGSFQPANGTIGNYVKFTIQATSFTLTATPGVTSDIYPRAPVNGIQIVPVVPPDFSLAASAAVVGIGATINDMVSVGFVSGFSGAVNLSVTGQPSGVTATLIPGPVSQTSTATLNITAGATTPAGTYMLTITGTSGAITHTITTQLTVSSTPPPGPTAISVDFVGLGTPMQPSEVAGVVAKSNWNNAAGAASTQPLALYDENGNATAASITWTSDNAWWTKIADVAGNARMMKGYLDTRKAHSTDITLTGLSACSNGCDVYVYVDGDNPGATRTGIYQISGSGIATTTITATDPASTDFSGTFQQAVDGNGNYVKFTIQATGFTLTATPGTTTDAYPRAPINGIQIVPVVQPPPPPKAISVDFVGHGTPMQPTEVAGVIAKANWNSAAGAASTQPLALLDENANATGASITWTSDNTWATKIADVAGSARMMKGYLDTAKTDPTVVTVTGLPPSATGYSVYVFIDGDNPGATRTAIYRISGTGITTTSITATDPASTDFSGTFQQASGTLGNYVKFTIQATSFTLTATPGTSTDMYTRAPINGVQIVPVGEQ